MSRVITFSREFPSSHPKKGQPTHFVEKVWESLNEICGGEFNPPTVRELTVEQLRFLQQQFLPKHHTIRSGSRWKVGDKFSPRVWSYKPYRSPMITIAPDIEIKKIWNFGVRKGEFYLNAICYSGEHEHHHELLEKIAINDGLSKQDLIDWFDFKKEFHGQVLCWNDTINY